MGPASTDHGPETDPTVILWDQPDLSLPPTHPPGSHVMVLSQRCMHKIHSCLGRPTWDRFLAVWVKVLQGWEEHPPHPDTAKGRDPPARACAAVHERQHGIATQQGCFLQYLLTPETVCPHTQKELEMPRNWQPTVKPSSSHTRTRNGTTSIRMGPQKNMQKWDVWGYMTPIALR